MKILFATRLIQRNRYSIHVSPYAKAFSTLNNNHDPHSSDNAFSPEEPPSKYLMYTQIFSFLKKYFIPFANPDSNISK